MFPIRMGCCTTWAANKRRFVSTFPSTVFVQCLPFAFPAVSNRIQMDKLLYMFIILQASERSGRSHFSWSSCPFERTASQGEQALGGPLTRTCRPTARVGTCSAASGSVPTRSQWTAGLDPAHWQQFGWAEVRFRRSERHWNWAG